MCCLFLLYPWTPTLLLLSSGSHLLSFPPSTTPTYDGGLLMSSHSGITRSMSRSLLLVFSICLSILLLVWIFSSWSIFIVSWVVCKSRSKLLVTLSNKISLLMWALLWWWFVKARRAPPRSRGLLSPWVGGGAFTCLPVYSHPTIVVMTGRRVVVSFSSMVLLLSLTGLWGLRCVACRVLLQSTF